ncbi:inositol 1,4,5-trisphosphate receptor-interacting protein-like 1 [Excalfactoria chinensis]|uniref:inositol 1,4,5-trisphosphate receptor-interacting protein-like 1 n=1 Tax=Excalfactoria chinensis TaxID=46218 RepID=UPI003B3B63E2
MALAFFFTLLAQRVAFVGDVLDAETLERMRQREVFLREQMIKMLLQIEEKNMKERWMLFGVLPYWKIWNVLCLFILLFWFMWKMHKEFVGDEDRGDEESSSSEEEQQQELEEVEEEIEQSLFLPDTLWPVQHHQGNSKHMLLLLSDLINFCQYLITDTFYPVPESPIGVGSAYEGWCPPGKEPIFCLLVPLSAPRGHVFHLDLDTTGELPARNSRIRVDLECTCGREQQMGMRCFLHTSKEELGDQHPNLLQDLCTDSYLDAEKTARWFQVLIKNAWKCMPQSATWSMNVVLCRRSCRLHLTDIFNRIFFIKVVFGVQQENTDIFLSSQETEAPITPSTTWPQSCSVAEAKFWQHITNHDEDDSFHLRCMQVCGQILTGHTFSIYELKTVLMHLLTAIPLESWHGSYFLLRVDDILCYLRCCVEEKHLNHFFIGNEDVPAEIILPQEFRVSQPLNLFQYLVQDPGRHEQALQEVDELQDRLTSLLIYGK